MQPIAVTPAAPSPVRAFTQQQKRNLVVEILVMLTITVICVALYAGDNPEAVNYLAPLTFLVVGGIANIYMVQQDENTLLTPLFALRLIALVVFGLGALLHNWITPSVQNSLDYIMVTSNTEAARVNLLWLGGMDSILLGVLVSMQMFAGVRVRVTPFAAPVSFNTALLIFWAGFAQVIVELSGASLTIANIVTNVFLATQLAGMFLMGRSAENTIASIIWTLVSIFSLILVSLLIMNKTVLLYPVLGLVLGYLSIRFSLTRIALGATIMLTLYFQIAPIVTNLRTEHFAQHGSLSDISVREQFDAVSRQLTERTRDSEDQSRAESRLDYLVPAAFAMNQYDSGFKLDIIQNSAFAIIPRFIWPDKPILTTGNDVSYRMGFQNVNSIGVTVPADIYWNLGWLGLMLMFFIGVYNGLITIYSRELMRCEDWFMLPFVMAAFRVGVSLDGEFVASIFVPAIVDLVMFLGLRALTSAIANRS